MRDWVMSTAIGLYTTMLPFYLIALAITIFILLPLAFWQRTRSFSGTGLVIASYVFGVTTWLLGAGLTFGLFGWFGLIIGLLIAGVGVVPLAIIGAIFKLSDGGLALAIFLMVVITLAARFGGFYASAKS